MTPARWRLIEEIYHSALEVTPDQLKRFPNESPNRYTVDVSELLEEQGRR